MTKTRIIRNVLPSKGNFVKSVDRNRKAMKASSGRYPTHEFDCNNGKRRHAIRERLRAKLLSRLGKTN